MNDLSRIAVSANGIGRIIHRVCPAQRLVGMGLLALIALLAPGSDISRPAVDAFGAEAGSIVAAQSSHIPAPFSSNETPRLREQFFATAEANETDNHLALTDASHLVIAQSLAPNAATLPVAAAATAAPATASSSPTGAIRGVTDKEIRFGLVGPFTGSARELGRQMKLGVDTAFNQANDAGGVNGRLLRLLAGDDGYEPTRTANAVKHLVEDEQVFGFIGNVGTPTAAVALPYVLDRHILFFGAFSGAGLLRRDPPDRYVFNYRASYEEETSAAVRYLVKVRRVQPRELVVFAQQDAFGDSGFAGVSKAVRALPGDNPEVVRLSYQRNSIDVTDAVQQMRRLRPHPKAVVMVATYRAAAKFIEQTRDLFPGLVYTNVSFVGSTALADELTLLGSHFATGVVVTQVVPATSSYSTVILKYKAALEKYFPGEAPDYVSLEGYVEASVLIEALRRSGPHFDTESLVETLENMRNFDIGLGTTIGFTQSDHQGVHKIWGTAIDENGHYKPIDMD